MAISRAHTLSSLAACWSKLPNILTLVYLYVASAGSLSDQQACVFQAMGVRFFSFSWRSRESRQHPTGVFIVLNIVRALSIIALLLVFASSIVELVDDIEAVNAFTNGDFNVTAFEAGNSQYIPNSTVPNQPGGAFWAVLNRIFILFQTVVLVLSEVGWPAAFFDRFFPVLGGDFGVGALGVMQCLLGASVLSHYVGAFPLATAFLLFSVGCLNMFVGLVFREKGKDKRAMLSWRERGRDVLPTHHLAPSADMRSVLSPACTGSSTGKTGESSTFVGSSPSSSSSSGGSGGRPGMGFGRQGEKAAGLKGFVLTRPRESLAKHAA